MSTVAPPVDILHRVAPYPDARRTAGRPGNKIVRLGQLIDSKPAVLHLYTG